MHISYKPLWHTLLERDMRKEDLRLAAGMTTNMIANMSKEGKHISMDTLARICETLNCEIISQTYLSALFSCQRAAAKACCFHVKAGAEQERGGTLNHAPPKTAYSSSSKSISSISKPKIILISASLIRPFNSISTTI